jgi:hypothetical protein
VIEQSAGLASGDLRLALAVSGQYGPAAEVADLAAVARYQPSQPDFEAAVLAPGAYSDDVRRRLTSVEELVKEALDLLGDEIAGGHDVKELSWQLLRGLYVLQLQMEGDVAPGRTQVITRLQSIAGGIGPAVDLFRRLVEITGQAEIRAGGLTQAVLRRELHGFGPLSASSDYVLARPQVDLVETELRRLTRQSLPSVGDRPAFVLDRSAVRDSLVNAITSVPPGGVVVRGELDVGKSAVALAAADVIRISGGTVLAMSLRTLPGLVGFRADFGLTPGQLLAAAPSAPLKSVTAVVVDGEAVHDVIGRLADRPAHLGESGVEAVVGAVRGCVGPQGGGQGFSADAVRAQGEVDEDLALFGCQDVSDLDWFPTAATVLHQQAADHREVDGMGALLALCRVEICRNAVGLARRGHGVACLRGQERRAVLLSSRRWEVVRREPPGDVISLR